MDHWQNTEQREDKYGDHGGDHQAYLQQKRRKLDDQRRRTEGHWFAGCVVWIDGLTDPPADDLEQLVVAGGGLVCDSRDRRATHIVAVNMTAAQTKKLKARKRGFAKPAVTPQWVVDSAARRCKLDPGPYLLWRASGPTDEALAVVRARNNLRKAGFGSEVVEEVGDDVSSASSAEEEVVEEEYVQGPSLLGRVEAWAAVGPAVAMFLGRADPENRATVLLLLELASELVERSRLEDVEGLMSLLEEHATAHPPWRKAARLLFDLVSFCVKERYGGALAGARPDWMFLGTPSQ
jgi:hypothetical protein